jgi:hypothetical protein
MALPFEQMDGFYLGVHARSPSGFLMGECSGHLGGLVKGCRESAKVIMPGLIRRDPEIF